MDAERLAELRAWADRLEERAENEETRAEARAIRMLTDEVEILQQKLAAATAATAAPATPATADPADSKPAPAEAAHPDEDEPAWKTADDRLCGSFFTRLKRTFGFQ